MTIKRFEEKHVGLIYLWKLIVSLLSLYVLFFVDLGFQPWLSDNELIIEEKIECNPYKSGCVLNLKAKRRTIGTNIYSEFSLTDGRILAWHTPLSIIYNNSQHYWRIITGDTMPHYLPIIPSSMNSNMGSLGKELCPYKISVFDEQVYFKCTDFKDYKSGEQLGWFNNNEFKVDHVSDRGCSYTVCKDSLGIEIVNKDHEVVFSISYSDNFDLIFSGAFTIEDISYVSYNTSIYKFNNVIEAEKLVDKINPVFDWTTDDGLGNCKRMIY